MTFSRSGRRMPAEIAFSSTRKQGLDLYLKPVSGTASEELLLANLRDQGCVRLVARRPFRALQRQRSQEPARHLGRTGGRRSKAVSGSSRPDSANVSASSRRTGSGSRTRQTSQGDTKSTCSHLRARGRMPEVKCPCRPEGAPMPRWRHDGKALFYIALDDRMMEVPIRFTADNRLR